MGGHLRFPSCFNVETPSSSSGGPRQKLSLLLGDASFPMQQKPLVHAKVLFVTLQKIYSTYTEKNGSFSLNIPSHLVDEANVIRVDYDSLQGGRDGLYLFYDNENFILSKNELQSFNRIYAEPSPMIMGMVFYERPKENPKVYVNGTSMDFNKYQKQYAEDPESYNRGDLYYFDPKEAEAITGGSTKGGLILFWDK
ncbi:MAG: hypothetical protein R2773_00565 [Flavobacteriaceae bacterium]